MKKTINKTKISWCDAVWNPCLGCLNDCSFCYARKMARRFARPWAKKEVGFNMQKNKTLWKYPSRMAMRADYRQAQIILLSNKIKDFEPVFLHKNFEKEFPKKPSKIFVNSMSDIKFWKPEWMKLVLEKIKMYPQHNFLFLTKFPEVYDEYKFPLNCWLGITILNHKDLDTKIIDGIFCKIKNIRFISIEPILAPVILNLSHCGCWDKGNHFTRWRPPLDWVIIGKQTGNDKNKVIPNKKWIDYIIKDCKHFKIPIWMKENLKPLYKNLIQEMPDE